MEGAMFERTSLLDETDTLSDDTLSDVRLDEVAGGEFTIKKAIDQASPNFFRNATAGAH
jgi:hypothetical protein